MAKKNRNTLKNYFKNGSLPSQEHFADLIDSMLNVIDEGIDKSPTDGLKISQLDTSGKLLSFYEQIAVKSPIWSIRIDMTNKNLLFGSTTNPNVLSLAPEGRIGINTKDPKFELDVAGTVASQGRIGGASGHVPADGQWHDLAKDLDGCHAYEIMAGVGGAKRTGQYALLHAFALSTYGGKSNLTYHQAHYDSRCNRLELRWIGDLHNYGLQIRTGCSYGPGISVKYYMTKLWFDPLMEDCRRPEKETTA